MFGWEVRFDYLLLIDCHNGKKNTSNADGCKHSSGLLEVEVVGGFEDQRDCGECHVEDSPAETYPETEECYDWFRDWMKD